MSSVNILKCNKQFLRKGNLEKKAWINILEITIKVCQEM